MTYPGTQLFIAGQWRAGAKGKTLDVVSPSSGKVLAQVARAEIADLDDAIVAVGTGFSIWSSMLAIERNRIMRKAAEQLRERAAFIAELITQEQGKTLTEAMGEVRASADTLEWYADESLRIYGRLVPSRVAANVRNMVVKDPIGPVAAFTPWNYPLTQVVRKVGAALAAGCALIVKAPEETPAAPAELMRALQEAGLPDGVVNLVFGDPAQISSYLVAHPVIRKITFTGSTAVGKQLAALAGQYMKRASMELGGHAPVLIAEDADLDLAVDACIAAKFRNSGQVCVSPSRFLVQSRVASAFAERFSERAKQLKVDDGMVAGSQVGPLSNPRRVLAMKKLTGDALARGATLLAGGKALDRPGNFWEPTVLFNVPADALAFNEEPFGPLASVMPFDHVEQAIEEANRLPYGLAAYAFTSSLKYSDLFIRRLQAGLLWINMPSIPAVEMPFGGVKDSGYGSDCGPEAIEGYLVARSISMCSH
ncbi:NAD-dependent succinate-semialdehyde dehydrogenase [Bordetella genomosp. 12]|uniref:NAD-dependent succinate-semialdehyde dehydrogenase n=1 Tax=Bordetella genomosp. 12 TaxID=463035 RepID=A0A261VAT5_9BORD|nr:NAD-dependent succinate-semialdehyde dehydrogenase [Bordetella genomosp. 12]OZI71258.1 NAD-dependent succinate-semialdehyde dehydrogenase [Bordetella genomosp. 12]